MVYSHLLMLFVLLITASCSGPKSPVKLKLANNFIMVNSDFRGGIIIRGEGITNPSYTFDVGANNGDAIDMTLPNGQYTIKVMAYETPAGSPTPFMGNPKCAVQNITVDGAQTFEIQTTTTQCANNAFASTNYRYSSGPKFFVFHSCGSLEGSSDPNTLNTNINTFTFCKNSYPPEIGKSPRRFKVKYHHQINGVPVGSSTQTDCLAIGSQTLRLPTALPLSIETFEHADCSDLPKVYSFANGIESGTSASKHLTNDSTNNYLTIFNGENNLNSGNGFGAFHTETPMFTCNLTGYNNACAKILGLSTNQYVIDRGSEFQMIKLPKGSTCTVMPSFGSIEMKGGYSCILKNGRAYSEIRSTVAGTHNVSWGPNNFQIFVGNTSGVYTSSQYSRERKLYQTLKTVIGFNHLSVGGHDDSLQEDYLSDEKKSLGLMGEVANLLSPFHLGGLFIGEGCSDAPLGTSISYPFNYHSNYRAPETVTAVLTDSPIPTPPAFIRNIDGPWGGLAGNDVDFHKRIILRTIPVAPALPKTFLTLDVACDNQTGIRNFVAATLATNSQFKIGRLERHIEYPDNGLTVKRRELLHYNTTDVINSRFDYYGEIAKLSGATVENKKKLFYRAEKYSGASDAAFRVSGITYDATRVSSAYTETLERFEIDGDFITLSYDNQNHRTYTYKEMLKIKKDNAPLGSIFSDQMFPGFLHEVYYGHKYGYDNRSKQGQVASHKDGNFVQAIRTAGGIDLLASNGTDIFGAPYNIFPTFIAADISPNGNYGIVVTSEVTNVRVYKFDLVNGSSWQAMPVGVSPNTNAILALDVAIKDDGTYVVGIIEDGPGNDDWIYFTEMSFGSSTFGSWNDPFSNDSDRQAYNLTLTRSGTQIYAGIASIQHLGFDVELHWCSVGTGGACSVTNDAGADVVLTGNSTAPFMHLQSRFNPATSQVEYSWVDTTMTARKLTVNTSLIRTATNSSPDYFVTGYGLYSNSSYYDTQVQVSLPDYTGYGHADVQVPFAQPTMNASTAKFQMNFMSLSDTVTDLTLTPASTLEATTGL